MIAASDPQEFVPSGRQQALRHPGPINTTIRKYFRPNEELLLDQFEKVSLKEKKESEWWILRKTPADQLNKKFYEQIDDNCDKPNPQPSNKSQSFSEFGDDSVPDQNPGKQTNGAVPNGKFKVRNEIVYMEDELYIKGNTAIWSRGLLNNCENLDNGRKTICAYTSPLPIKHALWCTFYCEHPSYDTDLLQIFDKQEGAKGVPLPAVCIIDAHNIRVFSEKGEDFVTAIPFQIGKVWNMKHGIFIENELENYNISFYDSNSSLYSLAYPLDEVCPVVVSIGQHLQMLNNSLKIVYTSENPSICMIFDNHTKQHSVYHIRKLTDSERMDYNNKVNSTCPSASVSSKMKSRLSMWDCYKNLNHLPFPSPLNSRPGSVASFHHFNSKSHSPMATMSRIQSPAVSMESPWPQPPSRLSRSIIGGPHSIPESDYFDCSKLMSYVHATPTICLDHIWTDNYFLQDENVAAPASKVFFTDDFSGLKYFCYILSSKFQLCLVRIEYTSRNSVIFGKSSSLSAKDAIPIPSSHMLAVLEHSGNVTLYSGLSVVGKLHIGGTLAQHIPSPYVRKNLSQFTSPFPRRSSLLPNCKQLDPKFEDHLLSPVLPEASSSSRHSNILQVNFQLESNLPKAVLNGLRDPVENRITLRYSDGTYYRITLPPLTAHPLIENCINTLRKCLVRKTASIVLTRWYATRNALGSQDLNLQQEWDMFEALLLELLGYEEERSEVVEECPVTPSSNPKRQRHSSAGSDADWLFMTNSIHEEKLSQYFVRLFQLKDKESSTPSVKPFVRINVNSVLFIYIRLIHYCFHLLYEDLKLNMLRGDDLKLLAKLLNKLSCDLNLIDYSLYYWKDFPDLCVIKNGSHISPSDLKYVNSSPFIEDRPVSIMEFIHKLINGRSNGFSPYPFIKHINDKSKDIIEICALIAKEITDNLSMENLIKVVDDCSSADALEISTFKYSGTPWEQATLLMTEKKITIRDLDNLPPGIYFLLYSALWKCRTNPPLDLPAEAYYLLWRDDLAAQALKINLENYESLSDDNGISNERLQSITPSSKTVDGDQQDGMEDIENSLMRLRFPDDVRVSEVRKMLQSSKPVHVVIPQRPGVTDHEYIEEQEKHLYAICSRTMSLSTGRGMLTLRTSTPVITEPLQPPPLCLTGKVPSMGTSIELNHIDTPSGMNLWPLFHNGVANGLRVTPDANNINSNWIIFNKPKISLDKVMEHAGFLMALGFNGHLKNLDVLSTYGYLSKLHEMTSIGVLLGLSAAFRGTSNIPMTKILSIHVEALLPPTSMELDVHQNVQVASLLGIGLVYQGTSHRHIIEVLLSEIGRPPGPEMENSIDRESYSLAAGLSLGLVTLKQGTCSLGLSDLNVPDTLHYYMVGGNRRALTGSQKDKYKVASFQIREGSSVNLDVTAPGATIALGLMYLGTGNRAVADWMAPPDTQYLLDFIRPDFLMFRILARALILLDDIKPNRDWIEDQLPSTIGPYCMTKPSPNSNIDYEAMNQAYCNIITGACFALGLKYAGSANEDAFRTLLYYCHFFTNLTIKSIAELAGKPTVETCLNVLLISTAMVMAGTGNLEIMRLVRLLRRRVGVASSAVVTYGSHLAMHMALGLLFLGGGRYTLSNSPANIAALICAFYPKFPTHSNDNRYHLQAFRHLYVLAVEPRLLIPKDVHSGRLCYTTLEIVKIDGTKTFIKGPNIIPDLNSLQKVAVNDERYWPVVFERGRNWDLLTNILSTNGFIEVMQRAGCLSYVVDKFGYHSQLAKTLTQSEILPWDPPASSVVSFTHNQAIKHFCEHFLTSDIEQDTPQELKVKQMLTKITYDAVVKDKLIIVPVFAFLAKVIRDIKDNNISAINLWQLKLLTAQTLSSGLSSNLVSSDVMLAIEQQVEQCLELWQDGLRQPLKAYLHDAELNCDQEILKQLAAYVIFYDIPFKSNVEGDILKVLSSHQYSVKALEKMLLLNNIK